jgi:2-polyprenyl-3-methyl-5-hydroxy-6-metoxy-1,4-benzoquinol methylase
MDVFDELSRSYKDILNRDIKCFGEGVEYFADYKAKYVRKQLVSNFEGSILDYGCGIGLVSKALRKFFDDRKVTIIGYDVAKETIREARRTVDGVMFTNSFENIANHKFDVIIVANVLHHVKEEDRIQYLESIVGNLKMGGKIFVFEHNPHNLLTRHVVRSCIFDRGVTLIRPIDMERLFGKSKITVVKKDFIIFFPKALKIMRWVEPVLGNFSLGGQYVFIGEI